MQEDKIIRAMSFYMATNRKKVVKGVCTIKKRAKGLFRKQVFYAEWHMIDEKSVRSSDGIGNRKTKQSDFANLEEILSLCEGYARRMHDSAVESNLVTQVTEIEFSDPDGMRFAPDPEFLVCALTHDHGKEIDTISRLIGNKKAKIITDPAQMPKEVIDAAIEEAKKLAAQFGAEGEQGEIQIRTASGQLVYQQDLNKPPESDKKMPSVEIEPFPIGGNAPSPTEQDLVRPPNQQSDKDLLKNISMHPVGEKLKKEGPEYEVLCDRFGKKNIDSLIDRMNKNVKTINEKLTKNNKQKNDTAEK